MPRLFTEKKLVIATHNKGKLAEFKALLAPLGIEVTSAGELGLADPEETGATFADNALIKARAACAASGLPALGDDSGLCVAALGGAPGIHSARWCGDARDPAVGIARIEEGLWFMSHSLCHSGETFFSTTGERKFNPETHLISKTKRDSGSSCFARSEALVRNDKCCEEAASDQTLATKTYDLSSSFFCSLALVWPDGGVETVEGECKGRLVFPPRGSLGHGYDPWFQPDAEARSFGEMTQHEKEALSHRGIAMRKLLSLFARP